MPFDFSSCRILLVGDVMLDRYVYGQANRLSPEAPVPVLSAERETAQIGGAGTVLRNLVSLGAQVTFVTLVGDDAAGEEVTKLVAKLSGCTPYVIVEQGRCTTVKTRHISGHHQVGRVDWEVIEYPSSETVKRVLSACQGDFDAVIISDYAKGVMTPTIAESLCKRPLCIVDSKAHELLKFTGCSVYTPNEKELEKAYGYPVRDVSVSCRSLMDDYGIGAVLATLGKDGMLLLESHKIFPEGSPLPYLKFNEPVKFDAKAREVYDVTGAGDTVVGVLALGLASGMPLPKAAELANMAAGIVVGKMGSAVVSIQEINSMVDNSML